MADQENVALMRRLIEVGIGMGDMTVIEEIAAPDCIEHQRGNNPGVDGAKEVTTTLHRWMSDFSLTVEDVAVSGDLV